MKRDRVQPVGAYGMVNFGDDLFVSVAMENSERIWPHSVVKTFVPRASHLYASNGILGKSLRAVSAITGAIWSDKIVFFGGSILQSFSGTKKLRLQVAKDRPLQMLGVSIGPFHSDLALIEVKRVLAGTDRLVVRDNASLDRLYENFEPGERPIASNGGDLAALSSLVRKAPQRGETITVCPSSDAGTDIELIAKQIVDAIDEIAEYDGKDAGPVRLLALSCNPNSNDRTICEKLAKILSDRGLQCAVEIYADLGLARTCDLIARSRMVWTERLHAAVVAYLSEVPFLIVGHHQKCVDFSNDIGLGDEVLVAQEEPWAERVLNLSSNASKAMHPGAYRERAESVYYGEPK